MHAAAGKTEAAEALAAVYAAIAEWFLYPEDIDPAFLRKEAIAEVESVAGEIDERVAVHLRGFHERRGEVSAEDYVNLLELNPRCPLYLGTYQFEEPKTCNAAGISDRNTYMLEIGNIYRHFGFQLKGELPDFAPAMAEFLSLTADRDEADAGVRLRLIDKLMIKGVRMLAERLGKAKTPYSDLADALLVCLETELAAVPQSQESPSYVEAAATGSAQPAPQLIQIEGSIRP